MPEWPLALRLLVTGAVFLATAAAFATGHMLYAVIGLVACVIAFQRMFLTF